jgi:hypothetical protein
VLDWMLPESVIPQTLHWVGVRRQADVEVDLARDWVEAALAAVAGPTKEERLGVVAAEQPEEVAAAVVERTSDEAAPEGRGPAAIEGTAGLSAPAGCRPAAVADCQAAAADHRQEVDQRPGGLEADHSPLLSAAGCAG